MYVEVSFEEGARRTVLTEAEDFHGFAVRVHGTGESGFAAAGEGEVYVPVSLVADLASGVADPVAWRVSYDGMLAYAEGKGWLSPDGRSIRAHVEQAA